MNIKKVKQKSVRYEKEKGKQVNNTRFRAPTKLQLWYPKNTQDNSEIVRCVKRRLRDIHRDVG